MNVMRYLKAISYFFSQAIKLYFPVYQPLIKKGTNGGNAGAQQKDKKMSNFKGAYNYGDEEHKEPNYNMHGNNNQATTQA